MLGGALERCERERCLLEERVPGGGELDLAAGAYEQLCAQGALELADLVAQRRLGDVEARGGTAEVQLLSDGQEVAKQTRLEINSPSLSITWEAGLGQEASSEIASVRAQIPSRGAHDGERHRSRIEHRDRS